MPNNALSWHKRWLALDDHRLRLLDTWCETTRRLEQQVGWFNLSDEERAAFEQTSGLKELDANLRLVNRSLHSALRTLPKTRSENIEAVVVTLDVAQRLIPAEENHLVHGLITRAVHDLAWMGDAS